MSAENSRILFVVTDLILPLIVGYFLHQKHLMTDLWANRIIKFNVIIIYTVLTLLSFWVLPITWDLVWLFPFGMMYVLVPGAIGALTFARRHKNLLNRGAYILSAMLSNLGTLGGVCAFILYHEQGFAYTQIVGTCQNILLVLVCFPLAQYYRGKHIAAAHHDRNAPAQMHFFGWNQLSLLGIALGLALNSAGIERPAVLAHSFQFLVHFSAWAALLPVGFLTNFGHARYYYGRVWDIAILRFLIMPAFIYICSRMVFTDPVLLDTLFICSMAPTAINAVLTSRLYKLNVDLAITSFIMTTALFLFVIFPCYFFLIR